MATSPLLSLGSLTHNAGTKIRNGYLAHAKWLPPPLLSCRFPRSAEGQKLAMATWPTCGQSGYITPTVSGVPNTQCTDQIQKRLSGPHVGKVATAHMLSRASPALNRGTQIGNGCSGRMWTNWLHHPCHLGAPTLNARTKISNGYLAHTCGQTCYITPAILGVPQAQCGHQNQKWLCDQHVGKVATPPLYLVKCMASRSGVCTMYMFRQHLPFRSQTHCCQWLAGSISVSASSPQPPPPPKQQRANIELAIDMGVGGPRGATGSLQAPSNYLLVQRVRCLGGSVTGQWETGPGQQLFTLVQACSN